MNANHTAAKPIFDQDEFDGLPIEDDDIPAPALDMPLPPRNPAQVAADCVLAAALEPLPPLPPAGLGLAVVIEVPDGTWVGPVAEAWQRRFETGGIHFVSSDSATYRWNTAAPDRRCLMFLHRVTGRKGGRSDDDGAVAATLVAGGSVLGVSPDPQRDLPSDLLRAADLHIPVPPLDAGQLAAIVAEIAGAPPTAQLDGDFARRVMIPDLCLARRPGEGADSFVARLTRLVEARTPVPGLTLDHLHGMNEARTWGMMLAKDLDEYRSGRIPWAALDKGCLLYGPPGTGKTTFARALAGSCGIPLVSASLAQWQAAGHLGDLLKSMRATFDAAKAAAPAILFVDEVDGFGNRTSFRSEYKDYSVQVVNGFLELLDGITGREGVIVVAACNHPERLDPAIVRSGRLERRVAIPLPDRPSIEGIFRHHLDGDLEQADLGDVSTLALGGSGADVEKWVRGARRRARADRRGLTVEDLVGEIRGSARAVPPAQLRRCAIHEAGHALVLALHRPEMLICATIRQTERTGGGVTIDLEQGGLETREDIQLFLTHLLAGRAAEEVLLGNVSAGAGGDATSDLARATALAVGAVTALGLGEERPLLWRGMPAADAVGRMLGADPVLARTVEAMLAEAYAVASDLVAANTKSVEGIVAQLIERETLDREQIIAAVSRARAAFDSA
ncbi:AAA family ATPase [Magnetospirillum sp. UT-4]|uniref:AAA family ATPase n=1 Tax=Magnetospirillum sp. UT-4 TaxID=2681467 RepID=UPI0013849FB2|nr:AAA family ATPase [Magnetospirillum sp. UT-4]CAA7627221.1 ATP-dependent Zn protease [Magnetospirillum sp. UT-4]